MTAPGPPPQLSVRRLLFPTDFSEGAGRALPLALLWARHFHADIDAFHVVPLPEENPVYPGRYATDSAEVWPQLKERVRAELERAVPAQIDDDRICRYAVARSRHTAIAIARYAVHRDIDVVVMSTEGRRGVRAFLMGSVTETAMREVGCPILALPREAERGVDALPTRVLAPIDFSPFALQTARHAKAAAAAFGADVLYLHVIESARVPEFYGEHATTPGRVEEELRGRARAALEDLDREAGGDARVEHHVIAGRPTTDITGFADSQGVDLIVIPTHGLSSLDRLLVGSVADKVVRRARCPVLILQPYGRQIAG